MRIVFFAVLGYVVIACLVLWNDIKDFVWTHPWYHSFLVAIPGLLSVVLAFMEMRHSGEANTLRSEANNHRIRANNLQEELDTERNTHLRQIASNTERPLTEAEKNARTLKRYLKQTTLVTEGENSWGAMGAIIAEVSDNHIVTLFCPAGYHTSTAYSQRVRCDKLDIVEEPVGGCALRVKIIERYGNTVHHGEAKTWEERNQKPLPTRTQRGVNVFSAHYRKDGSGILRHIFVYASTDGTTNYTLITMEDQEETNSWYGSKLETEKNFHLIQSEWCDANYRHDGGGGSGTLNLFTKK